jgi:hypothetical protein
MSLKMRINKKEIIAIVITIPIFTILAHLFGYWVWAILLLAPIAIGLLFYIDGTLGEKRLKKLYDKNKMEIKTKWDDRKKRKLSNKYLS